MMKTVTIAYALPQGEEKIILGIAETVDGAIKLIKKSGYQIQEHQAQLLALLNYTTNMEVNFKLETWQVH